jgi:hypothetical protein
MIATIISHIKLYTLPFFQINKLIASFSMLNYFPILTLAFLS